MGDTASCILHKTVATIISGDPYMQIMGKSAARVNDALSCGCKLLPMQSLVVGDTGPRGSGFAPSSASNADNKSNFVEDSKEFDLECTKVTTGNTFYSPSGVTNALGKSSSDKFEIHLKVKKGNFDRITVEVSSSLGNQVIGDQRGAFTAGSILKFDWDGFINDKYDSTLFTT